MPRKYEDRQIIDVLITWKEEPCTLRSLAKKKHMNVKTVKKMVQLYDLDDDGLLIYCSDQ